MNRLAQKKFVEELCACMVEDIVGKIQSGDIPEGWDQEELTQLVADVATSDALHSVISSDPNSARTKAYKEAVINTNLL